MPRQIKIGDGFVRVGYRVQVIDIRCLGILYSTSVTIRLTKKPWCQVNLVMETKDAPVYIDFIRFEEREIRHWVGLHRVQDGPSPKNIGEMLGSGTVRSNRKRKTGKAKG